MNNMHIIHCTRGPVDTLYKDGTGQVSCNHLQNSLLAHPSATFVRVCRVLSAMS